MLTEAEDHEPRAERIWVTVTRAKGFFSNYKGKLETNPLFFEEFQFNDEIAFEPRHIAQTLIKMGDPLWIDSADQMAFVSKMCLEKGNCVRFLYREQALRKEDSGWRMFSGLEPDGYANDTANISLQKVEIMLSSDPTLLEPLKGEIGSVYERDQLGKRWQKVTDWKRPNHE